MSDTSRPRAAAPPEGLGVVAPTPLAVAETAAVANPWAMRAIRYILPGAVVLAGIVVMALGSETDLEGGGGIVSAGLAIYLISWLFRAGTSGDREREAEDAAREYFDTHGRWPD
jgi:hypothetical protein